jgi:MFS family permease
VQEVSNSINWRNLIAACAAVCVFSFSLGEVFPLLSLNLESHGVSPKMIGLNAAMGPIGILLAGMIVPKLSHAFGPKVVALSMAGGAALIFLAYPTLPSLWAWFPLRLMQGICVATLFALSEAWVLANAQGSKRGLVIGVYATCISATFGVGPAVIGWVGIDGFLPFVIGAGVLLLTIFPISMVSARAGDDDHEHISILRFAPKAPLLLTAICVHAIFDGGMLSFLPVYAVRMGMSVESAAVTITALALGNVLFQIPIGWAAGRTSKAGAMITCFITVVLCLGLLPFAITTIWQWPLIVVAGAAGFGIYTVGLAELGDRFQGADLIAGTSSFAFMWGLGALVGSVICGTAMDQLGPNGFPGALIVIFIAYLLARLLRGWHRRRLVRANA